jgi:formate/nitrite transporter
MRNTVETVLSVLSIGKGKASVRIGSHLILAIFAGIYIGFGAALSLKIAGNLDPGWGNMVKLIFGLLFPIGLLMVLCAGASLFTGDVMYMSASLANKDIGPWKCFKFLSISYVGNLAGSILLAWMVFKSGIMLDNVDGNYSLVNYAINLSNAKTTLPFMTAFLRGILCNWLVCLAIFMSLTSDDAISKAALMWPPITAFVAMGMEHSVANMFFIPLGIFLGESEIIREAGIIVTSSWQSFFSQNLLPVTLGNIVGGSIFTAFPYLYLSKAKK